MQQTKKINTDTYIIADTHFGHENINVHEPLRKQKTYENGFLEPDEMMISNWNQIVQPEDIVLHLGDFAFKHKDIETLSNSLNGKKILLKGNHDKTKDVEKLKKTGWDIIDDIVIDIDDTKKVTLALNKLQRVYKVHQKINLLCCYVADLQTARVMFTHFPLFNDNPYDEKYKNITDILQYLYKELDCDFNIHGHSHSKGAKEDFCISACVEKIDFKPIKIGELLQYAK